MKQLTIGEPRRSLLPSGHGSRPVVLMIHDGYWQSAVADRTIMDWAAADLAQARAAREGVIYVEVPTRAMSS